MATVGTTSRPAYVYDQDTDAWVPVGVGPHTHENFVAATAIDAKGDLLAGSAPDTVGRLPIGANSTFLVADSSETLGLAWRNTITIASGSTVPLTIQNNGTGNSFVVNDEASDTTAFVIDASGNVGVGKISPLTKLDVLSGTANTVGDSISSAVASFTTSNYNFNAGSNPAGLQIMSNSTLGADVGATLGLGGRYTGTQFAQFAIIKGAKENLTDGDYSTYLAFGTRANGNNIQERMRIDSTGLVIVAENIKATKGFIYNVISTAGNYTAVIGDAGSIVTTNNSSATNFFINTNAAVPFATGASINIIQVGTGTTTIQATTPGTTTVASNAATSNAPKLRTQFSSATAIKISNTPEVWYVVGDIV
jgi:hypothetical protein